MKRVLILLIVVGLAVAAALWWRHGPKSAAEKSEEKPASEESHAAEESHVTHDESGRAVVKLENEAQAKLGLRLAKPVATELIPELQGYGRVLDPTPLAALMTELATAKAAAIASGQEYDRLQSLIGQGNASKSKLQAAQAAAERDQLAVQSAQDRLLLSWGKDIAAQTNLAGFVRPLAVQTAALVRIDLPAGETLREPPRGARVKTLAQAWADAEFLGTTAAVDPQTLGWGAIFLVEPNRIGLRPGAPVTGYLELAAPPLSGVVVPSDAVVRSEGRGWVFIRNAGGAAFTRVEVPLDRPTTNGWLVSKAISTNDELVVTGAQALLSEEQKSSLQAD